MLAKKAEVLVFLKLAGSISQADECLLDIIHPLAEGVLCDYMQANLDYQQSVEYLPIGQPQLSSDYPLTDVQFRGGAVRFINGRGGTEFLQLKHTPVLLAGLEVREDIGSFAGQADGAFADETILAAGTDFYLDVDDASAGLSRTGILRRIGAWPVEPRSVKVTYYGGYTATQMGGRMAGAVKLAAIETISAMFYHAKQRAESGGLGPYTSETIGKWSGTRGQTFMLLNLSSDVPFSAKQKLQPHKNYGRVFGG